MQRLSGFAKIVLLLSNCIGDQCLVFVWPHIFLYLLLNKFGNIWQNIYVFYILYIYLTHNNMYVISTYAFSCK